MDELLDQALREFGSTEIGGEVSPSRLWRNNSNALHKLFTSASSAADLCARISASTEFTFPRRVDDPKFAGIFADYEEWLRKRGAWARFPQFVQESPFVDDSLKIARDGRLLSAGFMLHVCVATRILEAGMSPTSVVEIGGGYGALARIMKMAYPSSTYVIVDLPHSLVFSSTFLRVNFPNARTLYIDEPHKLADIGQYDFVFVPAQFIGTVQDLDVDLAINVNSMGEMTQAAVDRYMTFINSGRVAAFYGINRFGTFESAGSPRKDSADVCNMATWLDPYWDLLLWNMHGENGFSQFETIAPAYLEVFAKRLPNVLKSEPLMEQVGRLLRPELAGLTAPSSDWHRRMWDICRYPGTEDLRLLYAGELDKIRYVEGVWYRRQGGDLSAPDIATADVMRVSAASGTRFGSIVFGENFLGWESLVDGAEQRGDVVHLPRSMPIGVATYGPYVELLPGDYTLSATFDVEDAANATDGIRLEVTANFSQQVVAQAELKGTDLRRGDGPRHIEVGFQLSPAVAEFKLEFRLWRLAPVAINLTSMTLRPGPPSAPTSRIERPALEQAADGIYSPDGNASEGCWKANLARGNRTVISGPLVAAGAGDFEALFNFECVDAFGPDRELRINVTDAANKKLAEHSIRAFPPEDPGLRTVRFRIDSAGTPARFHIESRGFLNGELRFRDVTCRRI